MRLEGLNTWGSQILRPQEFLRPSKRENSALSHPTLMLGWKLLLQLEIHFESTSALNLMFLHFLSREIIPPTYTHTDCLRTVIFDSLLILGDKNQVEIEFSWCQATRLVAFIHFCAWIYTAIQLMLPVLCYCDTHTCHALNPLKYHHA